MSKGTFCALGALLALVVGFVIGDRIGPRLAFWPFTPKGVHAIVVGPRAQDLSLPLVEISKKDEDVLFWVSKSKGRVLYIEFEEELFEGMKPVNGRFRVECKGRICQSGEIKPGAPENKEHKYWQILENPDGSSRDKVDGRIIINW